MVVVTITQCQEHLILSSKCKTETKTETETLHRVAVLSKNFLSALRCHCALVSRTRYVMVCVGTLLVSVSTITTGAFKYILISVT